LSWGSGFFLGEQLSGQLQEFFIRIFGDSFGWNIAINVNIGFGGMVGGLAMLSNLEVGNHIRINWKTVFASFLGFGLGNLLANTIAVSLESGPVNVSENIIASLQMLIWGLVGGASLAVPSRDFKRYLSLGVFGAIGMMLGQFLWNVIEIQFLLLGATLGLCLGISTKRISSAFILALAAILGFALRGMIMALYYPSNLNTIMLTNFMLAFTAGLTGAVIGLAWSALSRTDSNRAF
jgi:hypothetical protein